MQLNEREAVVLIFFRKSNKFNPISCFFFVFLRKSIVFGIKKGKKKLKALRKKKPKNIKHTSRGKTNAGDAHRVVACDSKIRPCPSQIDHARPK